jgi:hypothetical protein
MNKLERMVRLFRLQKICYSVTVPGSLIFIIIHIGDRYVPLLTANKENSGPVKTLKKDNKKALAYETGMMGQGG